jgi:LysR family cys regulon transcriptional activator
MNLRQFRYLCGIADEGFNISRAAAALHTSQPGVSKQVRLLEREIGVDVLARRGNRILGLTEAGRAVLAVARRLVQETETLKRIGEEFTREEKGRLVVATTHIHARYALRGVIRDFIRSHPAVRLVLRQGSPWQTAQLVLSGEADIGVSSEPPGQSIPELVKLPCHRLERSLVTPRGHPLLKLRQLTLRAIAAYPIVTYDQSFVGGAAVLRAFERAGIEPNIVLTATDADVIKSCVELGLGVAVLPSVAYEPARDRALRARDAAALFEPTFTTIELRRASYLRGYAYDFIARVAPQWNRAAVERVMRGAAA